MKWWECQAYINGMRRRERVSWTQTRWLGWLVMRTLGCKADSPEELCSFQWEGEDLNTQEHEEALRKLLDSCREENKNSASVAGG